MKRSSISETARGCFRERAQQHRIDPLRLVGALTAKSSEKRPRRRASAEAYRSRQERGPEIPLFSDCFPEQRCLAATTPSDAKPEHQCGSAHITGPENKAPGTREDSWAPLPKRATGRASGACLTTRTPTQLPTSFSKAETRTVSTAAMMPEAPKGEMNFMLMRRSLLRPSKSFSLLF